MKKLIMLVFAVAGCMAATGRTNISVTTDHTQLVLQVKDNGRLYQTYLGERLSADSNLDDLDQPWAKPTNSNIAGFEAYPVMGTEDYYDAAMGIRHADGNPTTVLKYVSHEQRATDGGTETIVRLKDEVYPVNVTLHYVAYAKEDIIKQWAEISHGEKGDVDLSRYFSSILYFESDKYYLTEFCGDWGKEMQMKHTELNNGKKILDSRLGTRTTMAMQPFFELGFDAPARENEGTVLMGTIAWTGNFRFTFEVDHNGALRVLSGINPDASLYRLKRGEVFVTPEFIFTLSTEGVGEGSRRFARWALNHQLFKGKEDRMTLLNNWENTYFDFNEEKLASLFDEARDLGVDLFLLDDGWFGNKYPRENDRAGLGDWQVNRKKLPNGVPYLVKTANEKGVEFGIWIEPEMVNPKSELFEEHPDWAIMQPNREPYYHRHQLVLDISNPKVQDYVFGIVDRIMTENPDVAYFKWDCNSVVTNIFSPYHKANQGNFYIDHIRGIYSVLTRIHDKYPDLPMMLCSGGGGRMDYEMLKYFTEFWCSDDTDPYERIYIQWGLSKFFPAKTMSSHVTNWNRNTSVKFRTDVCSSCKLGFDIDLKSLSAEEYQFVKQAVSNYDLMKPVIFDGDLYRLVSPYEGNHCAINYVSKDQQRAVLFAFDLHPRYMEPLTNVRLQGLDPDRTYTVRETNLMPGKKSELACDGKQYSGDYLMKVGLSVFTPRTGNSHVLILE